MSLITIDQLLESVDLDFEPRWVTKEKNGCITMWAEKPAVNNTYRGWVLKNSYGVSFCPFGGLKLAEFADKDWTECIYEVPRKVETIGGIERISVSRNNEMGTVVLQCVNKINELVDAVNELKGAKND